MRVAWRLLAVTLVASTSALDAKWTPNGEAPAPFSTNARQQMGMDPAAMAAGAVPPGGSVMLPFNLGALLVMVCRHGRD